MSDEDDNGEGLLRDFLWKLERAVRSLLVDGQYEVAEKLKTQLDELREIADAMYPPCPACKGTCSRTESPGSWAACLTCRGTGRAPVTKIP